MNRGNFNLNPGAFWVYGIEAGKYLPDDDEREWVVKTDGQTFIYQPPETGSPFYGKSSNSDDFIKEEWAHRYDTTGTGIYDGDIILINMKYTGLIVFYENILQWMINMHPDQGLNPFKPLSDFDCDENGVMANIQIIGNIHQELKKNGIG